MQARPEQDLGPQIVAEAGEKRLVEVERRQAAPPETILIEAPGDRIGLEIVIEHVGPEPGQEGMGFLIAMKVFDRSRPGTAAGAVGVAQRALELAANKLPIKTRFVSREQREMR